MAAEVVDPAFLPQLAHQCVDPGEAGAPVFPALEPGFGFGVIDGIFAGDEVVGRIYLGRKVPGNEADGGVRIGLSERMAERGLRAEIHISE